MKAILIMMTILVSGFCFAKEKELSKNSIYQMDSEWLNSEGEPLQLKSLASHPVILAMTYTGCQYSCPMTFKKLAAIDKDLQAKGVSNYKLVVASFDFKKDTPQVLKTYIKKNSLDPRKWTFITAKSDADVRKLAVILGVRYQKIDEVDFSHSNEINLLDGEGVPVLVLKGVNSEHEELVAKIESYGK